MFLERSRIATAPHDILKASPIELTLPIHVLLYAVLEITIIFRFGCRSEMELKACASPYALV